MAQRLGLGHRGILSGGRLLVLGNAGLDISLPLPRVPLPGETLVGGALSRAPGGKGLNQAVAAARTSAVPVSFMAPVGNDAEASWIQDRLRQEGFASLELPRQAGPSDTSVLLVLPDGENCIVTSGACAAGLPDLVAARFAGEAREGDWLLLQGNLSASATLAAMRAGKARAVLNIAPLLWDPSPMLALCSVVVANTVEARQVTGRDGADAAEDLRRAGALWAVVTLGAAGCVVAGPDGVQQYSAPQAHALDTSGAGDAFCGVLAAMLSAGRDISHAIAAAQRAAALTVTRAGAFAALPTVAELRAAWPACPA